MSVLGWLSTVRLFHVTIFELVKATLDSLYAEAQSLYGSSVDVEITKKLTYLSGSYGKLHDAARVPIDYEDPATRFAYVFSYVAAHGDFIVQVLEIFNNTQTGGCFAGKETL